MIDPTLPPSLHAFLRGIEPRACVLARAQGGPALDGPALVARVRLDFAARFGGLPLAEWPLRYWGLLLAREELAQPRGATPEHPLYALGHTRRLALLLRLVVGLEPPGAARVLGLSETAYRALWSDAEDKLAALGVGPAVLMRWQEAFQAQVRAEAVAAPASSAAVPAAAAKRAPSTPSRLPKPSALQLGLGAVILGLVGLLVVTFVWPPGTADAPGAIDPTPAVLDTPTRAAEARNVDADLVVDPDFRLLTAPADEPWRDDLGFLSWLTRRAGVALPAPSTAPLAEPLAFSDIGAEAQSLLAPVRGAWSALDADTRRGLIEQTVTWSAADLAGREALRTAYADWLAQPALERSALRTAYAAWRNLDASEREALKQAAQDLEARSAEEQAALRAEYALLDPQSQQDWAMGPRLGAQLPGLRPLLAFVPAGEQAALISAIESLSDADRLALAERVAGMGTAERAALRGKVLAATPDQRSALLVAAAAR